MNAYSTNIFNLEIDQEQPTKVIIKAQLSDYSSTYVRIGHFNFLYNEGSFKQLNGEYKDVKRFSTILNYFSKQNEFFGWQSNIVDQAKQNAKEARKQEKKEALEYAKQLQTERATDLLNKLNNKEESLLNTVSTMSELSDSELLERINNTFNNKITKQLANDILVAIRSYTTIENEETLINNDNLITNEETTNTTQENINEQTPEIFHLYSNTFNSYNEAYNFALNHRIPVTMILSSLHSTMTNERLKHLENEYVFSKHNMLIEDMKEYYNYIDSLPNTLDKEDRYYKLRSMVQRYESKQERIKQRKEEELQLAMQDKQTLEYMLSNGLTIEFTESGMQKYILDNQTIHIWAGGGLSANEYHDMIMKMYNNHFNEVTV